MEIKDTLIIAEEFSDTPGARDREDGDFSGQEFLEDLLQKRFDRAVTEKYILLVDLDGLWGWPSSFISGSFGKLSMAVGAEIILKHLDFKSTKRPSRIEKVVHEIKNPTNKL